jgi:hypothetical protein
MGAGVPYTQEACPGASSSPGLADALLAPTCAECGAPAHCMALSLVPAGQSERLPECADDGTGAAGTCVPDAIIDTVGKFVFMECTDILGTVGRCVPRCIAELASSSASLLLQDVCGDQELCAPCTDPTNNNQPTGACDDFCAAGDAGP